MIHFYLASCLFSECVFLQTFIWKTLFRVVPMARGLLFVSFDGFGLLDRSVSTWFSLPGAAWNLIPCLDRCFMSTQCSCLMVEFLSVPRGLFYAGGTKTLKKNIVFKSGYLLWGTLYICKLPALEYKFTLKAWN